MVVQQSRMIQVSNITKSFDGHPILWDVSMEIGPNEFVGVYGPSGIGKSTLAKILCGVLKPDAGCVYLNGTLLCSDKSAYDRKRGLSIQMVYQQPYASLDYNQKILNGFLELIRYHRFAGERGEALHLIKHLMDEVGLEMDILNHRPHQISGGEAQRIAIARCLLFTPQLLILDEATSMLDVSTQANVISLVKRVTKKNNGSVLLISHDRELVDFLCDQIYVFEQSTLQLEAKKS